jgi:hypothetical protein
MQQPLHAKAANGKDKGEKKPSPPYLDVTLSNLRKMTTDRRPVDPPPILKLEVAADQDPDGVYKQSKPGQVS